MLPSKENLLLRHKTTLRTTSNCIQTSVEWTSKYRQNRPKEKLPILHGKQKRKFYLYSEVKCEITCAHASSKTYFTLNPFLTYNLSIYSPPTVSSPLGNSDHCLITLRHDFFSQLDRPFAPQRVFHYNKADWDSLHTCCILLQIFQQSSHILYKHSLL